MYGRPYEDYFKERQASHPITIEQAAAVQFALAVLPTYERYNPEASRSISCLKKMLEIGEVNLYRGDNLNNIKTAVRFLKDYQKHYDGRGRMTDALREFEGLVKWYGGDAPYPTGTVRKQMASVNELDARKEEIMVQRERDRLLDTLADAAHAGNIVAIADALDAGADIKAPLHKHTNGGNALFIAIENRDFNTFDFLLKAGASADHRDNLGNTPAHIAAEMDFIEAFRPLADKGAWLYQPNDFGENPAMVAAGKGNIAALQEMNDILPLSTCSELTDTRGRTFYDHAQEHCLKLKDVCASVAQKMGHDLSNAAP